VVQTIADSIVFLYGAIIDFEVKKLKCFTFLYESTFKYREVEFFQN